MGILARMEQEKLQANYGPTDDFWYRPIWASVPTHSGQHVSPETAMRVTTVYACVKILSETVAQLPLGLFRRRDDGGKEKANDHPLYSVLRYRPNPWQGSYTWRETLQGHVGLRGNAYSIILPGKRGAVDSLIPVRPDMVTVEQLDNFRLRFTVRDKHGNETRYTQDEIFRIPGLSDDGITGMSPIQVAREAVGLAQATEAYGARFFKNDARPGGILSTEQKVDKAKKEEIRDAMQSHTGGANQHKIGVLDMGLTWTSIGMTSEDAQFLETRKFQREEICSLFRMPPHMAGDLSRSTNNNIEHQSIEFVVHTLLPWVKRWEEAISRDLIPEEERDEVFVEFDLRGLLRGESEKRAEYYNKLFNVGALSQNDIRRLENENPVEGGDRYFVPQNMAPSDRVDEVIDKQGAKAPAPAQPEPRQALDIFGVLVSDVAERIASAEIRELQKRADKAAEDRPRFDAWVAEVYEGHSAYVRKAVDPLARAWAQGNGGAVATDTVTVRVIYDGREAVMGAADVPALLTVWQTERAERLKAIIMEALHGEG